MGHRPATVLQEGAKKNKKHHFIPNCPRCHSNASLAFKHVSPLTTDQDFHSPQSVWFSPACSNWFMDSMVDHKTRTLIAKVVATGFSVRRVKVTGFDKDYYNNQQGCSLYYYICFKQHNPLPFRKKMSTIDLIFHSHPILTNIKWVFGWNILVVICRWREWSVMTI